MAISGKTYTDENGKKYWMDNQSEGEPLPYEAQVNLQLFQVSIDDLVKMMELYRFSAEQLTLLGHAAGRLGNAWITEMAFTEAIELEPDFGQAYADVISYHAAQQQWETCREFWEQGMLKANNKFFVRFHYGRALYMQEKFADALIEAQEALKEIEFQNEDLLLLALHAYLGKIANNQSDDKQGEFKQAKLLWQTALKRFPESKALNELENILSKDEFES